MSYTNEYIERNIEILTLKLQIFASTTFFLSFMQTYLIFYFFNFFWIEKRRKLLWDFVETFVKAFKHGGSPTLLS